MPTGMRASDHVVSEKKGGKGGAEGEGLAQNSVGKARCTSHAQDQERVLASIVTGRMSLSRTFGGSLVEKHHPQSSRT